MKRTAFWHACLVLALGGLGNELALAQSTRDCTTIVEDMARLKCYDEQAVRQKRQVVPPSGATASTPAPAKPAPPAQQPAAKPASSEFGLDADAVRKKQAAANPDAPKAPEQHVARVQAVVTKPKGNYRITLDDGQVWEETQHTGGLAPEVGETVTIKRGMLGSYFLSRSAGLALRVKRID